MKRYTEDQIAELAEILRNDGVVSVPTDTVYGVCARMDSIQAQENLRNVKNRPADKAFPIMCADMEQTAQIAEISETAAKVMKAFMPGPMTVILRKKENVPAFVNGGMDTLAIRLATSEVLAELIRETGVPLYMTSANQSGYPVAKTLEEIEESCPKLDGILTGEPAFGLASTIVDLSKDEIRILREGPVSMKEIKERLK